MANFRAAAQDFVATGQIEATNRRMVGQQRLPAFQRGPVLEFFLPPRAAGNPCRADLPSPDLGLEYSSTGASSMTNRLGRLCFWVGFLIYVASFWLTAVSGPGVDTIKPPSLASLAIEALIIPLFYSHQYNFGVFLDDLTFKNVSFFSVGWINPIFSITMILMLVNRTPRLTTIFRYIVLLFILLCWVGLIYRDAYPREGYFLWTAGIVLVLFSKGLPRWPVRAGFPQLHRY